MKALVVYDSNYGNTQKIAEAIAAAVAPAGRVILTRAALLKSTDLEEIDLLIVGSPTRAWRPTGDMGKFLAKLSKTSLLGVEGAAFDTGFHGRFTGSAAKRIEKTLLRRGCRLAAPSIRFFVQNTEGPLEPGELQRAREWTHGLLETAGLKKAA